MTRSTPVDDGEVFDVTDVAGAVPALEITDLSKTFGSTKALDGVDLALRRGEVHGFVGRNGSGKSTLIKVLSGYHAPRSRRHATDRGQAHQSAHRVRRGCSPGSVLCASGPRAAARDDGAREYSRRPIQHDRGVANPVAVRTPFGGRRTRAFGVKVSPKTLVNDLREVDRALVAIVRGLIDLEEHEDGILVLDEPTAYLPRDSVEQLFGTVRSVAEAGTTVMFVSHRLPEVMDLTDRTTVIRDGRVVATVDTADSTEEELIGHILGGKLDDFYPEAHMPTAKVALSASGISGSIATDVDITVHSGEIVGLTGIAGAGYDEVPYLLFGASPASDGQLSIGANSFDAAAMTPLKAMAAEWRSFPATAPARGGVGDFR